MRKFKGNPPNGDDWELISSVFYCGVDWLVHARHKPDEHGAGFLDVKVSANGFAPAKANYWIQWQIERLRPRKGKDLTIMRDNRSELVKKITEEVIGYIQAFGLVGQH